MEKTFTLIGICTAACLFLTACGESIDYFKTHDKERDEQIAKCSWNPSLTNCDAAEKADEIVHPEKHPFKFNTNR